MAGLTGIFAAQWRTYWRKLFRYGNTGINNLVLVTLFGSLGLAKFWTALPDLRIDFALYGLLAIWTLPFAADPYQSITPAGLHQLPLSRLALIATRAFALLMSPLAWLAIIGSLMLLRRVPPATLLLLTAFGIAAGFLLTTRRVWMIAPVLLLGSPIDLDPMKLGAKAAALWIAAWFAFDSTLDARPAIAIRLPRPPAIPGRLGGLLRKELMTLPRQLDMLLGYAIAALFCVYLARTAAPAIEAFFIAPAIVIMTTAGLALNTFGLDRPGGLERYHLMPVATTEILLVKDAALTLFAALQILPILALSFNKLPWLAGLAQAAAALLLQLAWGHRASIRNPYKQPAWSFSQGGSILDGFVSLTLGIVPPLVAWRAPTFAVFALAAISGAAYTYTLPKAAAMLDRDFERVRSLLS